MAIILEIAHRQIKNLAKVSRYTVHALCSHLMMRSKCKPPSLLHTCMHMSGGATVTVVMNNSFLNTNLVDIHVECTVDVHMVQPHYNGTVCKECFIHEAKDTTYIE